MSIVILTSGGVDSALVCVLSAEAGAEVLPLFIDYGQLAVAREWIACRRVMRALNMPKPVRMNLSGYGAIIPSGLTNSKMRIREDAFLPGRNMLLLAAGGGYARSVGASGVAIGLLTTAEALFPDQTRPFLEAAEGALREALGVPLTVAAPLLRMKKADVMALAKARGIVGTYSCHKGRLKPCNECISCLERKRAKVKRRGR